MITEPSAGDALAVLEDALDDTDSPLHESLSFSLAGGFQEYRIVERPGRLSNVSWATIIAIIVLCSCCAAAVAFSAARDRTAFQDAVRNKDASAAASACCGIIREGAKKVTSRTKDLPPRSGSESADASTTDVEKTPSTTE